MAYQETCNIIKISAKKIIPQGHQNNYIPRWDAECESLYRTFLQPLQRNDLSLAATALFAKVDKKRRDRCYKAVRATTFHTLVVKHEVF